MTASSISPIPGCLGNPDNPFEDFALGDLRRKLDDYLFAKPECETFFGDSDGLIDFNPRTTVSAVTPSNIYFAEDYIAGYIAMYEATQDHTFLVTALNNAEQHLSEMMDTHPGDGEKLEFVERDGEGICVPGIAGTCIKVQGTNGNPCDPEFSDNGCGAGGACVNPGTGTCVWSTWVEEPNNVHYGSTCASDLTCQNRDSRLICRNEQGGRCRTEDSNHVVTFYADCGTYGTCNPGPGTCTCAPNVAQQNSCKDAHRGVRSFTELARVIKKDAYLDYLYGDRADTVLATVERDVVRREGELCADRWTDTREEPHHQYSHALIILKNLAMIEGYDRVPNSASAIETYSQLATKIAQKFRESMFGKCRDTSGSLGAYCTNNETCCPAGNPSCGSFCDMEAWFWGAPDCVCLIPPSSAPYDCCCRPGENCTPSEFNQPHTTCRVKVCDRGFRRGIPCETDSECPGGHCTNDAHDFCFPQDVSHSEDTVEAIVDLYRSKIVFSKADVERLARTFLDYVVDRESFPAK